jgi:hypothetical protein
VLIENLVFEGFGFDGIVEMKMRARRLSSA